ncbi:MAG: hypothetical protein AXA67_02775 [Methylothermaceae bacteria B42]|nr:MAG: hypothetical protein AXA67_02775 [Methylothermaceae bacteria B42]
MGDIEKILLNGNIEKQENTDYGTKLIVSGKLKSPSGKFAHLITVWIVKKGENFPRFITSYPGGKK